MRYARAAALSVALAVATGLALGAATGGDGAGGAYRVRAIFDNASFVIPGEDVKVAGVKVGTIERLDLTATNKAAVVLRIDDPAFQSFRRDARCRIALQSLIGEQFVECTPTQRRAEGSPLPSALSRVESGPARGQYLLPVSQTTTPVGVDLLQNIMRLPERERFRLIINELGAGLAGNGEKLRAALRRADPALQQTDRVIAVLARQDRVLARLVEESDRVLEPLAKRRKELGGFIRSAGQTATATADRGDALERNFERLPGFLRRLRPAADRFGALADQMTPALEALRGQATSINQTVERLGPTARAAIPALRSLTAPADRGRQAFPAFEQPARDLAELATPLAPLAKDLAALSSSFDRTGGIEQVMRFIYFYTGSINGEDALGHYIRGGLQVSVCSGRVPIKSPGCEATFPEPASASAASERLLDFLLGDERR